jgi:NAD(P)-dependent dehydrogenase (short-subunit alcohol dehydrogenase family)
MLNLRGKNAMCVGATSGIGRAVAVRLAELQANVTVVGRNPSAGPEILSELTKANPSGTHSYVTVDASSMKSIKNGCDAFIKSNQDRPLHYLVMSQGTTSQHD